MAVLVWSGLARKDVDDIYEYIGEHEADRYRG